MSIKKGFHCECCPRGLCRIFSHTESLCREILVKIRRFGCQKYLYKKIASPDPGNPKKRGLGSNFFHIEKICPEKAGFLLEFRGKWGLATQKFCIDPAGKLFDVSNLILCIIIVLFLYNYFINRSAMREICSKAPDTSSSGCQKILFMARLSEFIFNFIFIQYVPYTIEFF